MAKKVIPLDRIRTDLNTQSRDEINWDVVDEYVEAMERGETFPPILVYYDKNLDEYILADGFHRYHALCKLWPGSDVTINRRYGTVENAQWASIVSNTKHGLRRTNADKRNAVRLALLHPNAAEMSDRAIGRWVGVDNKTVAAVRKELELSGEIPQIETRSVTRGGTTYQLQTTRIGRRKPVGDCGDCQSFNGRRCMVDEGVHLPWSKGCVDFKPKVQPGQGNTRSTPNRNSKQTDNIPTARKSKGMVRLHLPSDDPLMFAIEMRYHFSKEYLLGCLEALKRLEADEQNAE